MSSYGPSPIPREAEESTAASRSRFEIRSLWAVLLVVCLLCLCGLNARELWNNAEARVMIVCGGMKESGDWLRPTLFGEPRYEKPPLMYWATLGVAKIQGGLGETSAFWVSALSNVATALLLAGVVGALGDARAGALAGLMLVLSPGVFEYAREAQLDSLFSACANVSLLSFALWILRRGRWPAAWIAPAGVALGLAGLTKGPHALTFAFVPPLLFLAWRRRLDSKALGGLLAALGIGVALTGAWAALLARADPTFLPHVLRTLRQQSSGTNLEPPWYFIEKCSGWLLPWALLLPAVWPRRGQLRPERPADELTRFFGLAFLAGFVILSALPGKQRHYILPLMPSAMAWIALSLDARLREAESGWGWRQRWIAWFALALAAGCLIGSPLAFVIAQRQRSFSTMVLPLLRILAPAAAGFGTAFHALRRRRPALGMAGCALALVSAGVFYVEGLCPGKNVNESPKAACAEILRIASDPSELALDWHDREIVLYYLGGSHPGIDSDEAARAWMERGEPSYLLFFGKPVDLKPEVRALDGLQCREIRQFSPFTSENRIALLYANPAGAQRAAKMNEIPEAPGK